MAEKFDILVIGAGAVGCAIAKQLAFDYPLRDIAVLEKLSSVSLATSGRNSGVVHTGFHQNPRFLKSVLAREGSRLAILHLLEKHIPFMRSGMVIAVPQTGLMDSLGEWRSLLQLVRSGRQQDIDYRFLTPIGMRKLEPNIRTIGGIFIPEVCIVDPLSFTRSLQKAAEWSGARFFFNEKVGCVSLRNGWYHLTTENNDFSSKIVVNSAGLYADDIARLAGFNQYTIYPWRGEYYEIVGEKRALVRRLVYPVMPPNSPSKGAHFSPRIDGKLYFGPNTRRVPSKDCYEEDKTPVGMFLRAIQRFCPDVKEEDLRWGYSGIRPRITNSPEESDFIINIDHRFPFWINLIGIESPGLSAAMAIGRYVSKMAQLM